VGIVEIVNNVKVIITWLEWKEKIICHVESTLGLYSAWVWSAATYTRDHCQTKVIRVNKLDCFSCRGLWKLSRIKLTSSASKWNTRGGGASI